MKVVELTDEVCESLLRKLLYDAILDKLDEEISLGNILNGFEAWQFKSLLLFLLLALLLFLLLLGLDSGNDSHVLQFDLNELIDFFLVLILQVWHDFFLSHINIVTLLVVFAFISISPKVIVVLIELIELLYDFRRTELSDLLLIIVITCALLLFLAFLFLFFTVLLFLLLVLSILFILELLQFFFLWREWCLYVEALIELLKISGWLVSM